MAEESEERAVPLLDPENKTDARRTTYSLPEPKLFLAKCFFVWAATYAFIPLIAVGPPASR